MIRTVRVLFSFLAVSLFAQEPGTLKFEFIGNMAFRITDGTYTLFTDFPYTSGAFGYMKYDSSDIAEVPKAVCLITHAHADHWNPELFPKMKASLIAPPEIQSSNKVPFAEHMKYGNISVHAIRTPHAGEHYSYIVTWRDIRLFFSGDTEDPTALQQAKGLDVAFLSPWLLSKFKEMAVAIPAKKVVIYHHDGKGVIPDYQNRLVPKQGETFIIRK